MNAPSHMSARTSKKPFYRQLYAQVLIAITLGVVFGHYFPAQAVALKPLGDGFIKLIKMVIAPIIFCTVVSGIAHMGDMKSAGRLGVKALVYFEVLTTLALVIGLVIINFIRPGEGMNVDAGTLDPALIQSYLNKAHDLQEASFSGWLLGLIPDTFISGFAEGDLLQVLLVAILFAWAMLGMGEAGKPILKGIEAVSHVFFRIIGLIMHLAPLGAFGAMAFTIGKYGVAMLGNLCFFMLLFYASCLLFIFGVLGVLLKVTTGLGILQFIRYIKEELFIVLGTSSSETVLPRMLDKMQRLGCERQVVGMVIPTGYSFNLDGSSMYFTMVVVFLAQATNTPLAFADQLLILGLLLFTSKGAAAVVGSAFIVLTGTLETLNLVPVAAVTLVLGIDRFMSEARALTNLVGNGVATLVIAWWEDSLNLPRARAVLSGKIETHGETDPDVVE